MWGEGGGNSYFCRLNFGNIKIIIYIFKKISKFWGGHPYTQLRPWKREPKRDTKRVANGGLLWLPLDRSHGDPIVERMRDLQEFEMRVRYWRDMVNRIREREGVNIVS